MHWVFHTVESAPPAIRVLCRCGNASGDVLTEDFQHRYYKKRNMLPYKV